MEATNTQTTNTQTTENKQWTTAEPQTMEQQLQLLKQEQEQAQEQANAVERKIEELQKQIEDKNKPQLTREQMEELKDNISEAITDFMYQLDYNDFQYDYCSSEGSVSGFSWEGDVDNQTIDYAVQMFGVVADKE